MSSSTPSNRKANSRYLSQGLPSLRTLFQEYNQTFFANTLPELFLCYNAKLRKTYGKCFYVQQSKRVYIPSKIEIRPHLDEALLRETMVHEMCHAWAALTHREYGHGPYFAAKMRECGYPYMEEVAQHEIQFQLGDQVQFVHGKKCLQGSIVGINKRTISVLVGSQKWRVPPELLQRL
jgi:hypothetical protein